MPQTTWMTNHLSETQYIKCQYGVRAARVTEDVIDAQSVIKPPFLEAERLFLTKVHIGSYTLFPSSLLPLPPSSWFGRMMARQRVGTVVSSRRKLILKVFTSQNLPHSHTTLSQTTTREMDLCNCNNCQGELRR